MKIKFIIHAINSRRDFYGNCYWAFIYTDCKTGKMVKGKVSGGSSNVRSIAYAENKRWVNNFQFIETELPIREFNRHVKGWKYAGCTGEELLAFIRAELRAQTKAARLAA